MPERAECGGRNETNRYAGFKLRPRMDGAIFLSAFSSATEHGTVGELCGGANDKPACIAEVERIRAETTSTQGWTYAMPGDRAANEKDVGIATEGDAIRSIRTLEELREIVAPIESLEEAALMMRFSNRRFTCAPGLNNARSEADGAYTFQYIASGCQQPKTEFLMRVDRDGRVSEVGKTILNPEKPNCIEGRRPTGYVAAPDELREDWLRTVPAHIAEIAHMEEAAVRAFEDLHAALICVGAPSELVRRARQARRDEIAHAQIMAERAAALGAHVQPVIAVSWAKQPTLLELALDNAIEGCVRETYGALVATYQSRHAENPDLRAAFARIAADEAEHAALSQDLAVWFASKLDPEERDAVEEAKRTAYEDLRRECAATHPSHEVEHEAGMPRAEIAVALLECLRDRMKHSSSIAA
jgi:hypothetical protein